MIARIFGTVVHGKHLGRTIGFPTANIQPDEGSCCPADGVYAGLITIDGEARMCVINQGAQPTLADGKLRIEAHILDFQGDLYGRRVSLEYRRFLRAEARFESPEALSAQLKRDVERARTE